MSHPFSQSVLRAVDTGVPSQEEREVMEALRVQGMSGQERGMWLESVWGRVQRNAAHFRANLTDHPPGARHFSTLEEKNRSDETRELAFAMEHSVFAVDQSAGQHSGQ